MIDFSDVVEHLENGGSAKRLGWGYSDKSEIVILEHNSIKQFYISNTLNSQDNDLIGYGITYNDLKALDWILS